MNISYHRFSIDLCKQAVNEYVACRVGDTAIGLSVMLTESGTPYELTDDAEAVLAAKLPAGTYTYAAGVIDDNRITVTLPAELTASAGAIKACFRITGSSEAAITTPSFTILVETPAAPAEEQED